MATGPPPAESSIYDAKDLVNSKDISITGTDSPAASSLRLGEGGGGVWATGASVELYKPIAEYEGAHRYDPQFAWEEEEERKLVRKLDYRVCSFVCFMFFALQLDRGNISQALSDNMLDDLDMITNQYNYGMTIFYLCFLCAELPSQMLSKKLGPDVWIPIQMCLWSIVAICQCRITGVSSFYATRAVLGLLEGGFIPDCVLYLSFFYTSKELPIRLSFFWGCYISTQIISALLAYGILHLREATGFAGWRWLFAIEGALTFLIGVFAWFYMPPSPTQTASWFRGKDGWFSEHEEKIMVNRVLRDDPAKGGMHNRQGLTLSLLWEALCDYDLWPIYLLGLTWSIPATPITAYLTLNLKALGFSTFETNLLTIPAYVLFGIQLLFWTWFSERVNSRMWTVLVAQAWCLPLILGLELMPDNASPWSWYACSALLIGYPYVHAILVSITSRNAGSVRTRTVGSALYNMAVQASSIISSNIYRTDDAPYYRRGNKVILGIIVWSSALIIATKFYYSWRNKKRDAIWNAMTPEQRDDYLRTTTDQGNKRLDFRFAH
ncbi:major facilitator superfamily domain-containing protein [Coniella lustricola]|uniref:Major facilitator superfamily domain-containing protein n=1 Tax=Coniella lustricola TaxID=2025994 RepID=A0A2T3AGM9_9PEZI|nr:major facilitator superfamily domain-containing protein [Coniella lustricola]